MDTTLDILVRGERRHVEIDFLTWLSFVVKCVNGTRVNGGEWVRKRDQTRYEESVYDPFMKLTENEVSAKVNPLKISSTLRTKKHRHNTHTHIFSLARVCTKMRKDHHLNYFKFTYISVNDKQFVPHHSVWARDENKGESDEPNVKIQSTKWRW